MHLTRWSFLEAEDAGGQVCDGQRASEQRVGGPLGGGMERCLMMTNGDFPIKDGDKWWQMVIFFSSNHVVFWTWNHRLSWSFGHFEPCRCLSKESIECQKMFQDLCLRHFGESDLPLSLRGWDLLPSREPHPAQSFRWGGDRRTRCFRESVVFRDGMPRISLNCGSLAILINQSWYSILCFSKSLWL